MKTSSRAVCIKIVALYVISIATSAYSFADTCALPMFLAVPGSTDPGEVCVGHSRLFTVSNPGTPFLIGDVDVADETICQRVIRRAHSSTFEIIGLKEGETTLTIWPEEVAGTTLPAPFQVVVVVKQFSDRYAALRDFINLHLNEGLPSPEVNISIAGIPHSGKILVSGKVKYASQFTKIRSYIESAKIPTTLLVYEVQITCSNPCPCPCPCVPATIHCHRCFKR